MNFSFYIQKITVALARAVSGLVWARIIWAEFRSDNDIMLESVFILAWNWGRIWASSSVMGGPSLPGKGYVLHWSESCPRRVLDPELESRSDLLGLLDCSKLVFSYWLKWIDPDRSLFTTFINVCLKAHSGCQPWFDVYDKIDSLPISRNTILGIQLHETNRP